MNNEETNLGSSYNTIIVTQRILNYFIENKKYVKMKELNEDIKTILDFFGKNILEHSEALTEIAEIIHINHTRYNSIYVKKIIEKIIKNCMISKS